MSDGGRKAALVTGAAGGIGKAIVERLVQAGWAVVATDLAPPETVALPSEVSYRVADVNDAAAMAAAVAEAERLGSFEACIANAGLVGENFDPFVDADPVGWEKTFRVNVLGVMNTLQAATRPMVAAERGRLLATASVAGIRAEPMLPAYSASKSAVIAAIRSLAIELGPHGVTANAVAPGPTLTDSQEKVIAERQQRSREAESSAERFERQRNESRPLGRLATPAEVAEAYMWLTSEESRYITGQVVVVDGGGVLI